MSSVFWLAGNVTFSLDQICRLCLCRIFRSLVRHSERCCETKTRHLASKAFPHHFQIQSAKIQPLQPEHFLMRLPRLAQTTYCGRGRGAHTGQDQGPGRPGPRLGPLVLHVKRYLVSVFYVFQLTVWAGGSSIMLGVVCW